MQAKFDELEAKFDKLEKRVYLYSWALFLLYGVVMTSVEPKGAITIPAFWIGFLLALL